VHSRPSGLSGFFKGADTHFGVFYPRDYLIAVFTNLTAARLAERRLFNSGFEAQDVAAAPGEEVVLLAAERARKHGLWALLMQMLSRAFETEEVYADRDQELARTGAAFVMVYCPAESRKKQAWEIIESAHPLMARYYAFGGIEHLVGEA
jgi:hypothetical protein